MPGAAGVTAKSRGELVAFLGVVTLNQARRIEARLRRRRNTADVSLDAPIANGRPRRRADRLGQL